MKDKRIRLIITLAVILVLIDAVFIIFFLNPDGFGRAGYNPEVNPSDFIDEIDNKYFTLTPGKKMIYEAKIEGKTERTEVYVMNETRMVYGVETRVVWDRVWLDGELIEDTKDWYAQNKNGDVWYFGEDTKELIDGKIVTTKGSWEAGVDGAKPGIIMKGNPVIGDSYRQEYYAGIVEDSGKIVALNESVSVPFGSFTGCVKTFDWTPIEPGITENKYYCPGMGGVALEAHIQDNERVELILVEYDSEPTPSTEAEQFTPEITEQEAREIALREVSGTITDVAIEKKFGKLAYVVEILTSNGVETDVIIDTETGEILGVET